VKRGTLLLTVIAGLAVFLVILVLYLPASWLASALPPQVRCHEIGGSVWHGECLGLQWQGAKLGDATWNLAPGRALTGSLSGDIELRGTAVNLRSELDTNFSGVGELRNLSARLVLDPGLLPQFPPDQRGTVTAEFVRVELAEGPAPRALQGTIQLHDFQQVGGRPLELGSYQLTFDGGAPANGAAVGTLRDLGGPFAVNGTVTLTPPNAWLVQGYITGRTAEAERIVREITLGAQPDPSGRSMFSIEGSY
jgi:Type II secretion system (T2SS), protein N